MDGRTPDRYIDAYRIRYATRVNNVYDVWPSIVRTVVIIMVRATDGWSRNSEVARFSYQPCHFQTTTLGKLSAYMHTCASD